MRAALILVTSLALALLPPVAADTVEEWEYAASYDAYIDLPTGLVVRTAEPYVWPDALVGDPNDFIRLDVYGRGETTTLSLGQAPCSYDVCWALEMAVIGPNDYEFELVVDADCGSYVLSRTGSGGPGGLSVAGGGARTLCGPGTATGTLTVRSAVLGGMDEPLRTQFTVHDTATVG